MRKRERGEGKQDNGECTKTIPFTTIHGFRFAFAKSGKNALKMHVSCKIILRLYAHFSPISFQPPPEPPLRDGVVRGDKESLPRPAKENSLKQHLKTKNT